MAFGVYVHIPYCTAKCRYCDFYSRGASHGVPDEYISALLNAAERYMPAGRRPDTLYFGGGTPSLMTPEQTAQIISAINPLPGAEITLEANPETVNEALLEGFLKAGVNRLSLGVQTARDDSLARLGRPHNSAQARAAFAAARSAGFENISGDIMMALPQYSQEEFDETLDLIQSGGATHISAYLLKIEPNTVFGRKPPENLPSDDEAADFYLYGCEQLEKSGFAQYEISNFARPGFEGKHNLIYWDCGDYLGLGPAAHSCMGNRRFYWPSSTQDFVNGISELVPDGDCGVEDFIILQLRLASGLSISALKSQFGLELTTKQKRFIDRCVNAGYACFDGETLKLTSHGMILQNSILCGLLD